MTSHYNTIVIFVTEKKLQTTLYAVICIIWRFPKSYKQVCNITVHRCMTQCKFLDSCSLIEEHDVSIFKPALYRKNGKRAFIWKAASYFQIYTASYLRYRSSDHDCHLNVKSIITFCHSATYKPVDRPVSAKVLVRRSASVFRVDLENGGRTFCLNVQNVRCCNPKIPRFNDSLDCYNIILVLECFYVN